jgi:glutamate/tyrosine decarboxylase-like PLP-dependent enzyme
MTLDLFQAPDDGAGYLTSGGTESLFQALYTAREWARETRAIDRPNVVTSRTAHASLEKSAHYLGVEIRRVHELDNRKADVDGMRDAMDDNTVLLLGSAPAYPHGVFDPIGDIAALADSSGVLCHADACVGGFLAPFMRDNGEPIPPFDFAVPGVTSLSADLHKYGYSAKGASVILYRDSSLAERQSITCDDWPYGPFTVSTFSGSRPAGPVASAWAVMHHLGRDGYGRLAEQTVRARNRLIDGVKAIGGLEPYPAKPELSIWLITSPTSDIHAIAAAMEEKGWVLFRCREPAGIHVLGDPFPDDLVDRFLGDLADAASAVSKSGATAQAETGYRT